MPYNTIDQVPAAVKKRGDKKAKQWMAVWNDVFQKTKSEKKAFQAAYGAIGASERFLLCSEMKNDVFHLLSDVFEDWDPAGTYSVQVMREGLWQGHPEYGDILITRDDIHDLLRNWLMSSRRLAMDYDHGLDYGVTPEQRIAAGWHSDVWVTAEFDAGAAQIELKDILNHEAPVLYVWAKVEATPRCNEYIQNKEMTLYSPTFNPNYTNKETGEKQGMTLLRGAITNVPWFDGMQEFRVAASERFAALIFKDWDTAYINNLPDAAFAYIAPGGKKDGEGKTTPRSLRNLPYKGPDGKPDAAHVRAALSYLSRTDIPADAKAEAKRRLDAAAKELGIEEHTKVAVAMECTPGTQFVLSYNGDKGQLEEMLARLGDLGFDLNSIYVPAGAGPMAYHEKPAQRAEGTNDQQTGDDDAVHTLTAKQGDDAMAGTADETRLTSERDSAIKRAEEAERKLAEQEKAANLAERDRRIQKLVDDIKIEAHEKPMYDTLWEHNKPLFEQRERELKPLKTGEKGAPGAGGGPAAGGDVMDEIEPLIEAAQRRHFTETGTGLPRTQAITIVMTARPDLQKRYRSQMIRSGNALRAAEANLEEDVFVSTKK